MNGFADLKNQLPERNRLLFALAVGMIGAAVLGNILLIGVGVVPKWRALHEATTQLQSAQEEQSRIAQSQEGQTVDSVQTEINDVKQKLAEKSSTFLSEAQAAQALDHLYNYAAESGAAIVNVQNTPTSPAEDNTAEGSGDSPYFEVRAFQTSARGSATQLLDFLGRIEETSLASFQVGDVTIEEDATGFRLDMTVSMTVSPYADQASSQLTTQEQLEKALVTAWDTAQWQRAIDLLDQLQEEDPSDLLVTMQLYTAHMNYGNELLGIEDAARAESQFEAALALRPGSEEAILAIQQTRQQDTQASVDPASPAGLTGGLDAAWSAGDWPKVIDILKQLRALDPSDSRWPEKLYSAYVNNGYTLTSKGEYQAAKASFSQALDIKPNGGEAISGLQALSESPESVPVSGP